MDSVRRRKAELRKLFRDKRTSLSPDLKKNWDLAIADNVMRAIPDLRDGVWTTYNAQKGEVDPAPLMKKLNGSITWAYPVVQNQDMKFYVPTVEHDFAEGELGIFEPRVEKSQEAQKIRVCVVPGVAFDEQGQRLGSGKGYYDRFLKAFKGITVGLAYEVQISESTLPHEPHDKAVDFIVTEKRVLKRAEE